MASVHRMFRREFSLAALVVRACQADDADRAVLITEHLGLMTGLLHSHHDFEDTRMWPLLVARVTPDDQLDVDRVASQHADLDLVLAEVGERLVEFRNRPGADENDRLSDALDRLLPTLLDHMDYEERFVVPLMQQHIGVDEWDSALTELGTGIAPEHLPLIFGMQMYEDDPQDVEHTISKMPAEIQPVIRSQAGSAYASLATSLYGTPRPPRGPAAA
ncbi:MAG: hemerythrin domain-containing protein [Umezawaea sp.]